MTTASRDTRSSSFGSPSAIMSGVLGATVSVVLVFAFPLVAPLFAVASGAFSALGYRRTRKTVWIVLLVVSAVAFIGALFIDLFLLKASDGVTAPNGPVPTRT